MSEIDFNAPAPEPATAAQEPAATKPERMLPAKHRPVINDRIPAFSEMRLPRINICQNIGGLSENFQPGEVVYRQTTVVYSPERKGEKGTAPGELVILGLLPDRWVERVAGGEKGRIVMSPEEARSKGGTTDYDEWKLKEEDGMAYFEPLAEFICLLKWPKHLPGAMTQFPFKIDEDRFALGIWGMKSTAYNNCAKYVFSDRSIGPTYEGGYPSCLYQFTTWLKPFGKGKSAWVPAFKATGPTTESFQKFAHEIIASAAEAPKANDDGGAEE